MKSMRKYAVLTVFLSVGAFFWSAQGQTPTKGGKTSPAPEVVVKVGDPIGISGCSGNGCHGAPIAKGTPPLGVPTKEAWRSAYTHWLSYDNHSRAFAVLREERAMEMMKKLSKLPVEEGKRAYHTDATQESRCLACHANPALAFTPADPKQKEYIENHRLQGIGCEACHGNASEWRGSHVNWKDSPDKKDLYDNAGMIWLNDPVSRARACAGCHVGAPPDERSPEVRNMNHDMIAAGHPRLNFEFSSYLLSETPHWIEKDRLKSNNNLVPLDGNFHARNWLIGRAVQMEQAMALLEYRTRPEPKVEEEERKFPSLEAEAEATRKEKTIHSLDPWPELAEFNCYACHSSLRADFYPPTTFNPSRGFPFKENLSPTSKMIFDGLSQPVNRPLGSWLWDPLFSTARTFNQEQDELRAIDAFLELQKTMQLKRPKPEIRKALLKALPAWRKLSESLAKLPELKIEDRRKALEELPKPARWDDLAQTYFGLRALNNNTPIPAIEGKLSFPYQSPTMRQDSPQAYESHEGGGPVKPYDPTKARSEFKTDLKK